MATVNGENLVPLGRGGTGAAVVLNPNYTPLQVLQRGAAVRAQAAAREAALKQKAADAEAKRIADIKYTRDGSVIYGDALNELYKPVEGQLVANQKIADPSQRAFADRAIIQNIQNEQGHSKAKTEYSLAQLSAVDKDAALYNLPYIHSQFSDSRKDPATGNWLNPSQHDPVQVFNGIFASPSAYNEGEVVQRAVEKMKLFPERTELYTSPGGYGGVHTTDQIKTRLVKTNGQGVALLNADQSPALDFSPADERALLSDPLVKMQYDKRVADYEAARAADPSLPAMSQHGHLAMMLRPLAQYSTQHTQALNPRTPQPRAGAAPKVTVNANANTQQGGTVGTTYNGHDLRYSTSHVIQAPTKTRVSTGQTEGFAYDNAKHTNYTLSIPGRDDEVISNNQQPQNVQYGGGYVALVTPSGKKILPPKGQVLQGQALYDFWREQRAKDPRLTPEFIVEGSARKGKNELGDRESIADQLAARYAARPRSEQRKRPAPSRIELLKEADDIIGKQNASYQFIYSDKHPRSEKRHIDTYAPGAFNSPEKAAEIRRAVQEADEATKPRASSGGSIYQRPASKTNTNTPPPPSRGGSVYKTR